MDRWRSNFVFSSETMMASSPRHLPKIGLLSLADQSYPNFYLSQNQCWLPFFHCPYLVDQHGTPGCKLKEIHQGVSVVDTINTNVSMLVPCLFACFLNISLLRKYSTLSLSEHRSRCKITYKRVIVDTINTFISILHRIQYNMSLYLWRNPSYLSLS